MANTFHVNGPAIIKVGTGGAGALEEMGLSVDGVSIDLRLHTEDVHTDVFGPYVPQDVQYFLEEAFISFDLIWYDRSIVEKTMARLATDLPNVAGVEANAGVLYGQGNNTFRLLILPNPSLGVSGNEVPWNFPNAFLQDSTSFTVGTRRTVFRMTWRALPIGQPITGDKSLNLILYNRVVN